VAALNRAQVAVVNHPNTPSVEEALMILIKSYDALGMVQLRDDARRVLAKNFPQSPYLTGGVKAKTDPWWKVW
jgi:outer membrane protein assembly factor BamD